MVCGGSGDSWLYVCLCFSIIRQDRSDDEDDTYWLVVLVETRIIPSTTFYNTITGTTEWTRTINTTTPTTTTSTPTHHPRSQQHHGHTHRPPASTAWGREERGESEGERGEWLHPLAPEERLTFGWWESGRGWRALSLCRLNRPASPCLPHTTWFILPASHDLVYPACLPHMTYLTQPACLPHTTWYIVPTPSHPDYLTWLNRTYYILHH